MSEQENSVQLKKKCPLNKLSSKIHFRMDWLKTKIIEKEKNNKFSF